MHPLCTPTHYNKLEQHYRNINSRETHAKEIRELRDELEKVSEENKLLKLALKGALIGSDDDEW